MFGILRFSQDEGEFRYLIACIKCDQHDSSIPRSGSVTFTGEDKEFLSGIGL